MTARVECVSQPASTLLDSHVRSIYPGNRSATLACAKMLGRRNTAVTRVWKNPEMAMVLSSTQYGPSESFLTRTFATRHWRASANRASANRASASLA